MLVKNSRGKKEQRYILLSKIVSPLEIPFVGIAKMPKTRHLLSDSGTWVHPLQIESNRERNEKHKGNKTVLSWFLFIFWFFCLFSYCKSISFHPQRAGLAASLASVQPDIPDSHLRTKSNSFLKWKKGVTPSVLGMKACRHAGPEQITPVLHCAIIGIF